MSQSRASTYVSLKAGDTLAAYLIVAVTDANTVNVPQTTTQALLGVTQDAADSGTAVNVIIAGTAKVICASSISAGALVAANTATGYGTATVQTYNTGTVAVPQALGIALQAGSTNSVIEVTVSPRYTNKVAYA